MSRNGGCSLPPLPLPRTPPRIELRTLLQTLVLDGVFTEAPGGGLAFHPAPGPSDAEVAVALATIRHQVLRLLVCPGLEPADDATGPADRLTDASPVLAGIVGGLGARAGGGGPPRGGAGAAARRRERHAGRDGARAGAGAPRWLRPAHQRVGVGARSGRAGSSSDVLQYRALSQV